MKFKREKNYLYTTLSIKVIEILFTFFHIPPVCDNLF